MTIQSLNEARTIALFLSNINIVKSGCWEWTGLIQGKGYGAFRHNRHYIPAHRFAYELFNNTTMPVGLEPDHLCRNRRCVNPAHLEAVTHTENVLRGDSPKLARQRQLTKTHCPHNHPYTPGNTYIKPNGWRECRQCKVQWQRDYISRKKESV